MSESGIVVAKTGFWYRNRLVRRGETFAADHPLVKGHERHFKPLVADGMETATAAPGPQRVVISPLQDQRRTPPTTAASWTDSPEEKPARPRGRPRKSA